MEVKNETGKQRVKVELLNQFLNLHEKGRVGRQMQGEYLRFVNPSLALNINHRRIFELTQPFSETNGLMKATLRSGQGGGVGEEGE